VKVLLFFPIALVISIVLATLKCDRLGAIARETLRLFVIISASSAAGGLLLFFLVKSL